MPRILNKILRIFFFFAVIILCLEMLLSVVPVLLRCSRLHTTFGKKSDAAVLKILCLGDSFTYGWGAEKDLSYPSQLETLLLVNNPGQKFKIINLGAFGISSSMAANNLAGYLEKYRPDVLIVLVGANDRWNIKDSNILKIKRYGKISKFFIQSRIFLYNFKTFRLLHLIFNQIRSRPENRRNYSKETINISPIDDVYLLRELIRFNLIKIVETINSYDKEVRLFFQTYPARIFCVNDLMRNVAGTYKISLADQESAFRKATAPETLFASDGWHLNAHGYNLMAVNIYEQFIGQKIIKNKLLKNSIRAETKSSSDEVIERKDGWQFDLIKIAKHPEKLISLRSESWCFFADNIVNLPEVELVPGEYALEVTARGTAADDVYPLMGFYYQSDKCANCQRKEINKVYVDPDWKAYPSERIRLDTKQKITFYVSFENDLYKIDGGKVYDRNLYVKDILLNSLENGKVKP